MSFDWIGTSAASKQNRKAIKETNAANLYQFQLAHGAGGNSALPWYLKTADGKKFERKMGRDLVAGYEATGGDPATDIESYRNSVDSTKGMQEGADRAAAGIYDGSFQRTLEADAAPTQAARLEVPALKKQAAREALSKTLGEIEAHQAARGFGGDGLARARLTFDANRAANTDASMALSDAHLANAAETQAIRDSAAKLQLSSLQLPGALARNRLDLSHLPEDVYLDQLAKRSAIFNPLKGFGQPFQYQSFLPVQNGSMWGDFARSVGTAGAIGTRAALDSNMADRYRQQYHQQAYQNNAWNGYSSPTGYAPGGEVYSSGGGLTYGGEPQTFAGSPGDWSGGGGAPAPVGGENLYNY